MSWRRLEAQGFRPYVIPVGGSNALGALGMWKVRWKLPSSAKVLVSPPWWSRLAVRARTPGWRWGWNNCCRMELIGVTVSRSVADQKPKVVTLQQAVAEQLELKAKADILLWDDYFAPGYGTPNEEGCGETAGAPRRDPA
jgi:D-cysteine desulfhydrase